MSRAVRIFVVLVALSAASTGALAGGKVRLAQSGTVTTCMVNCNTQAANCQSSCILPSAAAGAGLASGSAGVTPTPNAAASSNCLLSCTTTQLSCQTSCARQSPSP